MMDVLPGLYLLLLRCWPLPSDKGALTSGRAILAAAFLFAIYVNSYQGLFNRYTIRWNQEPAVDSNAKSLFDWRYPQFLHNKARHHARLVESDRVVQMGLPKLSISYDASEPVLFESWSRAELDFRWSEGSRAAIFFPLEGDCCVGRLTLLADYYGRQKIIVSLNGVEVARYDARNARSDITVEFDPALIANGELNTLEFFFPDARRPNNGDKRFLAMAFKKLEIR